MSAQSSLDNRTMGMYDEDPSGMDTLGGFTYDSHNDTLNQTLDN